MTHFYQPLDLTMNGSAKGFIATKFNSWYAQQISDELESGKPLEEIDIKLRLSALKPLHLAWVVDFYRYTTSADGKEIVINGWKSPEIYSPVQNNKGGINKRGSDR